MRMSPHCCLVRFLHLQCWVVLGTLYVVVVSVSISEPVLFLFQLPFRDCSSDVRQGHELLGASLNASLLRRHLGHLVGLLIPFHTHSPDLVPEYESITVFNLMRLLILQL